MKRRSQRLIGPLAILVIVLAPAITWIVDSIGEGGFVGENPYSVGDLHLVFIVGMLAIIIELLVARDSATIGDESKIILNRNQTDYYEIWEEVRSFRDVEILAVGHSFNTLWFNFLKKFLYEVANNDKHWDSVSLRLISSRKDPASYQDIRQLYGSLEMSLAAKISISLASFEGGDMFFTGLCVNKSALWLSIREPHETVKSNEHVREWRRSAGGSAEKMVNWYVGLAEHLELTGRPECLHAKPGSSTSPAESRQRDTPTSSNEVQNGRLSSEFK